MEKSQDSLPSFVTVVVNADDDDDDDAYDDDDVVGGRSNTRLPELRRRDTGTSSKPTPVLSPP